MRNRFQMDDLPRIVRTSSTAVPDTGRAADPRVSRFLPSELVAIYGSGFFGLASGVLWIASSQGMLGVSTDLALGTAAGCAATALAIPVLYVGYKHILHRRDKDAHDFKVDDGDAEIRRDVAAIERGVTEIQRGVAAIKTTLKDYGIVVPEDEVTVFRDPRGEDNNTIYSWAHGLPQGEVSRLNITTNSNDGSIKIPFTAIPDDMRERAERLQERDAPNATLDSLQSDVKAIIKTFKDELDIVLHRETEEQSPSSIPHGDVLPLKRSEDKPGGLSPTAAQSALRSSSKAPSIRFEESHRPSSRGKSPAPPGLGGEDSTRGRL